MEKSYQTNPDNYLILDVRSILKLSINEECIKSNGKRGITFWGNPLVIKLKTVHLNIARPMELAQQLHLLPGWSCLRVGCKWSHCSWVCFCMIVPWRMKVIRVLEQIKWDFWLKTQRKKVTVSKKLSIRTTLLIKIVTKSAFFFLANPKRQYSETAFRMWSESISRIAANWNTEKLIRRL